MSDVEILEGADDRALVNAELYIEKVSGPDFQKSRECIFNRIK